MPGQAQRLWLEFHEVRQPAVCFGQRFPRRRADVQELRDIARQKNRRELAAFGVADLVDQVASVTGAQVRHNVVADQHAEARLRRFFAFTAVAHYFHDLPPMQPSIHANERRLT